MEIKKLEPKFEKDTSNPFYGKKHSLDSKRKMSETRKNLLKEGIIKYSKPFYGKKHSKESRLKMSASHRGRKHSVESRNKMSLSKMCKWNDEEIKFIKDNYDNLSDYKLALKLNKTQSQVIFLRKKLGINKNISKLMKNSFLNGRKHHFLGKKLSEEHKQKLINSLKGRKSWNRGLTKETDEKVKTISEKIKKTKNLIFWKENIGFEAGRKMMLTKLERGTIHRGKNHHMFGKNKENSEWARKSSERMKINNPMKNPEIVKKANSPANMQKRFQSMIKKPNIPEKIIVDLIKENNLPFLYTGNGVILIGGFNPDFLSKELNKIIEVNGDYWHNLPKNKLRDIYKYENYKRNGYKTLILWEHEVKNNKEECLNKIINFVKEK